MRKHHAIHLCRVEVRELTVNAHLVFTVSLVHTAIQKNFLSVYFQQMLGTSRCFSCSTKMNFHYSVL